MKRIFTFPLDQIRRAWWKIRMRYLMRKISRATTVPDISELVPHVVQMANDSPLDKIAKDAQISRLVTALEIAIDVLEQARDGSQ